MIVDVMTHPELDAPPVDLRAVDTFARRHIGPTPDDVQSMLSLLGYHSLDELIDATVPSGIRLKKPLNIPEPLGEHDLLVELKGIARQNQIFRSLIGMGYYDTVTPGVILRNIFENPGWYTQYTPYQAEIAQGRLEALLNYQTMVADLTGLPLANASLLDEATAAAEAMAMCNAIVDDPAKRTFFISTGTHPQTIAVVEARAKAIGVTCVQGDEREFDFATSKICGALLQYPTTDGRVLNYGSVVESIHAAGALAVVASDLLALTLIKPPGEFGADIAVGSAQRLGVPMGFGGPHAAFMATTPEHVRKMPGRIVGVSKDAAGNPAFRLALQTREQHIRRDKATSNICTAQVLLAIIASMYAVYHGPRGLKKIAQRIHRLTRYLAKELRRVGHSVGEQPFFDTLRVHLDPSLSLDTLLLTLKKMRINVRVYDDKSVGISLDEASDLDVVTELLMAFQVGQTEIKLAATAESAEVLPPDLVRTTEYLTHPVFNRYHSETEMLRYIKRLESRDLSLAQSMIPLGSCTMKLNATSEMIPVTWPEFGTLHPFAPTDQTKGYQKLFRQLEKWLANITGFAAVSLQPNAGSQGEYAGLLVIRAYHESRGDMNRDICLIPTSAHGTNPASAVVAGFQVVAVACDAQGNVDIADLRAKASEHKANLGALMVTYPSTHGVFEEGIKDICKIVHDAGGQVYMDGANMNAQVGLTSPGAIGADVCHLNLHKTFCIPHGGGGPGMGPIGVAKHLAPFLPGHPLIKTGGTHAIGAISAAPFGSASILPISYVYIALMGGHGLKRATEIAILNANYIAKRLEGAYDVLYKGTHGRCAHECIIDARGFEATSGVKVEDICKRLMDYGFHAPTMSFPVPGTIMIEPTESESRHELDRFCDAMLKIRDEIRAIEAGTMDRKDNPLKNAPHTAAAVTSDTWAHTYGRELAAYPAAWLRDFKFWPAVARIDNPYGDRNLICTCPPMEAN